MRIYGKQVIKEAFKTPKIIKKIVLTDIAAQKGEYQWFVKQAMQHKIPIEAVDSRKSNYFKDYSKKHQNISAEITEVSTMTLQEYMANNLSKQQLILVLDHIEDPYNFGGIIRTADALGVDAIIFPKNRQVAINSGVIEASCGAVFFVNLVQTSNIFNAVKSLKNKGVLICASHVEDGVQFDQVNIQDESVAVVVGNEGKGVSKHIVKIADYKIHIERKGKLSSMNVSVATGIFLYHFNNQLTSR